MLVSEWSHRCTISPRKLSRRVDLPWSGENSVYPGVARSSSQLNNPKSRWRINLLLQDHRSKPSNKLLGRRSTTPLFPLRHAATYSEDREQDIIGSSSRHREARIPDDLSPVRHL